MHYGYSNGSGDYYIVIDAEQCDGCRKCVRQCPRSALEMITLLVDLEDKAVAAVAEQHRKRVKYTCASCKPEENMTPCILACAREAITCVWKPR